MNKLTQRFAAWAACLAILMAALAPSISHALSAARGANISWMEICSVSGTRLVKAAIDQVDAAPSSSPSEKGLTSGHCPFCSTHAASLGLPPAVWPAFPVVVSSAVLPSLFYQSPSPLYIWATAQSRAPPLAS